MKLKNVLIAVENIERSAAFYKDLFGLQMMLEQDGNVILTEGLVLQKKEIWEKVIERTVISQNNSSELYFEEPDLETFAEKLKQYPEPIQYVNRWTKFPSGQQMIRFYDPDGNLIEVRTPVTPLAGDGPIRKS